VAILGIPVDVAKVMVSLPDELLQAVDAEAAHKGTTRSGYLRQLAEDALRKRSKSRSRRMAEIDHKYGPARGHGGRVAEHVKKSRPSR
jgi:metal-responsive CopG/Arc/MetJ family transcriptional regulator